jgi:hypothetical protein
MLGVVAEFRAARAELVGIAKAKRRGRSTRGEPWSILALGATSEGHGGTPIFGSERIAAAARRAPNGLQFRIPFFAERCFPEHV